MVEKAARLNPRHHEWYYSAFRDAYFHNRRFQEAVAATKQKLHPNQLWDVQFRALSYAQLGDQKQASQDVAELMKSNPEYSAEKFLSDTGTYLRETELDLYLDSVRKSGLPLCATAPQLAKYPDLKRLPACDAERAKAAAVKF